MLTRITKWTLLATLVAVVLCTTAVAQDQFVALGSDYLATQPGTFFNFGSGIGVVDFMGNPIGPGYTDTIIQRMANADITTGAPISIQIVALSMESTMPVNIGGTNYNVFLGLDPGNLNNDIGRMSIMGNIGTGGTFSTLSLNVYFDAKFVPIGTGQPFDIKSNADFSSSGSPWYPTPPPGAVIVSGPFGDQNANQHSGLPDNYSDFWPGWNGTTLTPVPECVGSDGCHYVLPASTPEPSTIFLLGPAGIGLFWKLRARRSSRV